MDKMNCRESKKTILNLLAGDKTCYDYPTLQIEAVEAISSNITDIVYNTLKQKDIQSTNKRGKLLRLLQNISSTSEFHLSEDHYKIYLNIYEQQISNDIVVAELLNNIEDELSNCPANSLHWNISEFYKRKNKSQKLKMERLRFIKQMDQEATFKIVPKSDTFYETSQNLIDELISDKRNVPIRKTGLLKNASRKEQAAFCYALVNMANTDSDIILLEKILTKIASYDNLEPYEVKLVEDLWTLTDDHKFNLTEKITKQFPFILEKVILEFCSEILKLENSLEIVSYFRALSGNIKCAKLKEVCRENMYLHSKMKNLIFELYVLSGCNENILKLSDCLGF